MAESAILQPLATSFLSDVNSARAVVIFGFLLLLGIAAVLLRLTGVMKRFKHRHDPGARYEGRNQKKRYRQELKTRQALQAARNSDQAKPDADQDDPGPSST